MYYGNYNMFQNNLVNNMYNTSNMNMNMGMNMNSNFQNNFNYMNNSMYNNNFNNNFNNMNSYNMMMNMIHNQNMLNIYQNQQKIEMMKQFLKKKELMDKILNESNNQSNDQSNNQSNDNNDFNNNFNEQQQEEVEDNMALFDVAKENEVQRQKFEQYQTPNNINYSEVDPEFMHTFISDKALFCGSGHNLEGKWAHGENRGGRPYNPPDGWIGFGLNVLNKYDNGNNDWLACDGRPGEWCVAYHGACVNNTSDQIKQIIKPILEQNLKPGSGQAYSGHDDANHPGQKVGIGVYCSPNPTVTDGYAGIIEVNGYSYRVAFMLRVKPDKIRYSNSRTDYWVLNAGNGDFSELRPYRFLIKKV